MLRSLLRIQAWVRPPTLTTNTKCSSDAVVLFVAPDRAPVQEKVKIRVTKYKQGSSPDRQLKVQEMSEGDPQLQQIKDVVKEQLERAGLKAEGRRVPDFRFLNRGLALLPALQRGKRTRPCFDLPLCNSYRRCRCSARLCSCLAMALCTTMPTVNTYSELLIYTRIFYLLPRTQTSNHYCLLRVHPQTTVSLSSPVLCLSSVCVCILVLISLMVLYLDKYFPVW